MEKGKTRIGKPFVKWVGGKSQLLKQYDELLPDGFEHYLDMTYIEPFVGGGAMLFHMLQKFPNIKRAIINDINSDLITTYSIVKENPRGLIAVLAKLQDEFRRCANEKERRKLYIVKRARYNARTCLEALETASLFIFLNRTGFNGLYRVNSLGEYNVSFGKCVNPTICDADTILADSELLQKVEIRTGDYSRVFDDVRSPAFVYLDPPYRPLTTTANFTSYSKEGFGDVEQRQLALFCRRLNEKGIRWLTSNSDPHNANSEDDFFDDIYEGFEIRRVVAKRMVNSDASGRGLITELAIRNYAR